MVNRLYAFPFVFFFFLGHCEASFNENQDISTLSKEDRDVLSILPEEEVSIVLNRKGQEEQWKTLGKKYVEKCDSNEDSLACYMVARMTSDKKRSLNYFVKGCSVGDTYSFYACKNTPYYFGNELFYRQLDEDSKRRLTYGRCFSRENYEYCIPNFEDRFIFDKVSKKDFPYLSTYDLYYKEFYFSQDIYDFKKKFGSIKFTAVDSEDSVEYFCEQIFNLIIGEERCDYCGFNNEAPLILTEFYHFYAFINLMVEDNIDGAFDTLRRACIFFIEKIDKSGYIITNQPIYKKYQQSIQNASYKVTDSDRETMHLICRKTADREACELALKLLNKKEAESLKLELCKIWDDLFPDCNILLDGF